MNLRPYQSEAIRGVVRNLHKNPVLVAPTGAGKTYMASELVRRLNGRTLWVAHRRELIDQAAGSLRNLGLRTGIIRAGDPVDYSARMQVASIQTLARREVPPVDTVVIDEAHRARAASYAGVFDLGVPVVGLTATPFRLDGRSLGDVFGEIVVASQVADLVALPGEEPCDARPLHRPEVYSFPSMDLDGVGIKAGDFDPKQVAEALDTSKLFGDIVTEWKAHAPDATTVVFAVNVEHSKAIAAAFNAAGVTAEHVDGSTPTVERDAILDRLRSGETRVVCNCLILTEGWDLPSLECVVIARPTASLNIHIQTVGRVMRHTWGKARAIVLDHAGNHHRHGAVTRRLNYTLDDRVGAEPGEALGLRRCEGCAFLFGMTADACPACGMEVSRKARDGDEIVEVVRGKLVRYGADDHEFRREFFEALKAQAVCHGQGGAWVIAQYKDRFRTDPIIVAGDLADPRDKSIDNKRRVFAHLMRLCMGRGHKPGWAQHRYREFFGVWPVGRVRA